MGKQYITTVTSHWCVSFNVCLLTLECTILGAKGLGHIGRADFRIEITIICELRLSVTLRQNEKDHCFSGGVIKLDPSYTRPHVLETQEHSSKESCCLSYGLNFIILMQSSKSMPGSRLHCQVFYFFLLSPLKRALTSHEARHYQTSLTSSVSG